ncbi:uracil-DNA glycosylase [endosymbiont of Pachyrhynchus infernalis]|uniref:uracil-DNA glycosylase n=1 Tax=endosymbiont of Pachyrhynchus infernalis TaxID=1971488 RepID=UPI000DC6FC8D|nr:uracil-DNA glycosylase [endosymbiont of Pachyrhynchus infernalis]BBA84783.1 uracil-DNA glycosylase [endosymbiont of Pachyrhynchus infernalis]
MNWKDIINKEKNKNYFIKMNNFIYKEIKNNKIIYPKINNIFNSFKLTPFDITKIVIIGQDPYPNINQANGLSFSVNLNSKIPKSLNNIFIEIKNNINNFKYPKHGYLKYWSNQGILLLNRILTVEKNKPLSHSNIGWEIFTENILKIINNNKNGIIFVLWGNYSKKIEYLIDKKKHFILKASHPSPLSANKGFFGCKHFIKINNILKNQNKKIIDWNLF